MKIILHSNSAGDFCITTLSPDYQGPLSLEQIAIKDVEPGFNFWIEDDSVLPPDGPERDAWELEPDRPADGKGADFGAGSEWAVIKTSEKGTYHYCRKTIRDKSGKPKEYKHRIVNALTGEVISEPKQQWELPDEN